MTLLEQRDVGALGEIKLDEFCAQVGITANKAQRDKTGWDHLLEFPLFSKIQPPFNIPLDIGLQPLQCIVQVKSTDDRSGKISVKMDNWVRFIKSPLPTFFLVFEYDGKNLCQRAYLVHVDKSYIEKVLKRLRKIGYKNKNSLHKKKLQFTYKDKHQIPQLNGEGLKKAIKDYVGASPEQYAKNKLQVLQTLGYKNKNLFFNFEISLPDKEPNIEEYLIDFSIGLIPSLKVSKGEVKDIRFGIIAEEPLKQFKSGRLEIDIKPDKGEIVLSSEKKDRRISIETDVYLPHGLKIQPGNYKVRFATAFLDFILWPFKNEITLNFHFPEDNLKYSLTFLKQMADIVLFLCETGGKEFKFEIKYKENNIGTGKMEQQSDELFDDFFIQIARSIKNAWNISKHFNVHHEIEISPQELFNQEAHLQFMENIITRSGGIIKVAIWPDEDKELPDVAKKICVPFLSHVIIGQYQMAVSAGILEGSLFQTSDSDGRYEMVSTDIRLCRQYIWERGTEPPCTEKEALEAVIIDFDDLTKIVLLKGIHDNILDNTS